MAKPLPEHPASSAAAAGPAPVRRTVLSNVRDQIAPLQDCSCLYCRPRIRVKLKNHVLRVVSCPIDSTNGSEHEKVRCAAHDRRARQR